MEQIDLTKDGYHLQLVVRKEGEVTYATFSDNNWTAALDCFLLEASNPKVSEARLILHRRGSVSNDDHIRVEEYP